MDSLHESVLLSVLRALGVRGRIVASAVCRRWRELALGNGGLFEDLHIDALGPVSTSDALTWLSFGRAQSLCLCSSGDKDASLTSAETQARFKEGIRCDNPLGYALRNQVQRLAGCLRNLRVLSIDERVSCLGGLTDDLARALAKQCSGLQELHVAFEPHSLPAELFTDAGLIALAEGVPQLRALALHGCNIGDRSLYATAAYCSRLTHLRLSGYSERITNSGLTTLFGRCIDLRVVEIDARLFKVTDVSYVELAHSCAALERVEGGGGLASDAALRALGECCGRLQEVLVLSANTRPSPRTSTGSGSTSSPASSSSADASPAPSPNVTHDGLAALLLGRCRDSLQRVALPRGVALSLPGWLTERLEGAGRTLSVLPCQAATAAHPAPAASPFTLVLSGEGGASSGRAPCTAKGAPVAL